VKRQELLRQLDEELTAQRKSLDALAHRIKQFEEEEKQKIPKWARRLAGHYDTTEGKWYPVEKDSHGYYCRDNKGDWRGITGRENLWELCYSDNPPEEEKYLKPNGLPVGEYYISIDDGWVEYRYRVSPKDGSSLSIDDIAQRIYKALNAEYNRADGVVRPK
jgi:hypothetical protein